MQDCSSGSANLSTLWEVFNNKIFVAELLTVLFSVVAVVLTVPVTTWVVGRRARAGRAQKG
nr:YibE/F family protein [Lacticaseibacillus thailandensis]